MFGGQTGGMLLYSVPHICALWPWYLVVFDPLITPIVLPITQMAMTGSVYSVVAVALERYFNICKPFRANWVRSVNETADLFFHTKCQCAVQTWIRDIA